MHNCSKIGGAWLTYWIVSDLGTCFSLVFWSYRKTHMVSLSLSSHFSLRACFKDDGFTG